MQQSRHASKADLATAAAAWLTDRVAYVIRERGQCSLALSGGTTPWAMLAEFAQAPLDWSKLHVFQVDERRAPEGDPARNWTHITSSLIEPTGIPKAHQHPMPIANPNAASAYEEELSSALGPDRVLDIVQLGLGADGHTASLIPGDPVLEVTDRDVAWAGPYQGTHRLSLTYPALDRARERLWLVAGDDKAQMVERMLRNDREIPAGRIQQAASTLFVS